MSKPAVEGLADYWLGLYMDQIIETTKETTMKYEILPHDDLEGAIGDFEIKISMEDYLIVTYEAGDTGEQAIDLALDRLHHAINGEIHSITAELKATYN